MHIEYIIRVNPFSFTNYLQLITYCPVNNDLALSHILMLAIFINSTFQLQGNIRMHPRRVLHAFQMCPTCVPYAYCMRVWVHPASGKKEWQSHFITRFRTCTDSSRASPRCVLYMFQTHLACILDACESYLGAELYRNT